MDGNRRFGRKMHADPLKVTRAYEQLDNTNTALLTVGCVCATWHMLLLRNRDIGPEGKHSLILYHGALKKVSPCSQYSHFHLKTGQEIPRSVSNFFWAIALALPNFSRSTPCTLLRFTGSDYADVDIFQVCGNFREGSAAKKYPHPCHIHAPG